MSINTWTVNKEEDIRKMVELGVDQITTDNPLLVRQVLHQMGVKEKKAR
jgi:glycerophosphoryl diester phosphodiesterase